MVKKRIRISIIGSGWVGTALGKRLAELGNEVIFYDVVDKKKHRSPGDYRKRGNPNIRETFR